VAYFGVDRMHIQRPICIDDIKLL